MLVLFKTVRNVSFNTTSSLFLSNVLVSKYCKKQTFALWKREEKSEETAAQMTAQVGPGATGWPQPPVVRGSAPVAVHAAQDRRLSLFLLLRRLVLILLQHALVLGDSGRRISLDLPLPFRR